MSNPGIQALSLLGLAGASLYAASQCIFTVQPGHIAIKFSKLTGLKDDYYKEGFSFRLPYFENPIIYNIQTKPTTVRGLTANRDMQNVNIGLRVLYRPKQNKLIELYRTCGLNYDERVLPSIINETMKAVIAQYGASQLMSQRDQISNKIRGILEERASNFFIVIDDVSIVDMNFTKEYAQAVEAKQVAQQEAERAKFVVEQAKEHKKSIIIKATGEAKSFELIGRAASENPSYVDLRKIEYAKEISSILGESRNHMLLDAGILNIDVNKMLAGPKK